MESKRQKTFKPLKIVQFPSINIFLISLFYPAFSAAKYFKFDRIMVKAWLTRIYRGRLYRALTSMFIITWPRMRLGKRVVGCANLEINMKARRSGGNGETNLDYMRDSYLKIIVAVYIGKLYASYMHPELHQNWGLFYSASQI